MPGTLTTPSTTSTVGPENIDTFTVRLFLIVFLSLLVFVARFVVQATRWMAVVWWLSSPRVVAVRNAVWLARLSASTAARTATGETVTHSL